MQEPTHGSSFFATTDLTQSLSVFSQVVVEKKVHWQQIQRDVSLRDVEFCSKIQAEKVINFKRKGL